MAAKSRKKHKKNFNPYKLACCTKQKLRLFLLTSPPKLKIKKFPYGFKENPKSILGKIDATSTGSGIFLLGTARQFTRNYLTAS
jgi:hypothetical protein